MLSSSLLLPFRQPWFSSLLMQREGECFSSVMTLYEEQMKEAHILQAQLFQLPWQVQILQSQRQILRLAWIDLQAQHWWLPWQFHQELEYHRPSHYQFLQQPVFHQ